jgi:hypothetical protein
MQYPPTGKQKNNSPYKVHFFDHLVKSHQRYKKEITRCFSIENRMGFSIFSAFYLRGLYGCVRQVTPNLSSHPLSTGAESSQACQFLEFFAVGNLGGIDHAIVERL